MLCLKYIYIYKLDTVVHACNPNTLEAKTGKSLDGPFLKRQVKMKNKTIVHHYIT